MSIVRFAKKAFHVLWRGADTLRKILHLLVLLFVFSVVIAALSAGAPQVPASAALLIQPQGVLVEQLEGNPFDRGLAELMGEATTQTLVREVVDGLEYAADDKRITTVVLDLRGFAGADLAKLQRVAAALVKFRESGKPIIAHGDYFSQGGYYLAANADEVYMHPEGLLLLQGFGAYRNYYKEAIDTLKIDWNVFRAGGFKSAVEPYLRNDMSDEDRSSISRIIEQLWNVYQEGIATARDLPLDSADQLQEQFAALVEQDDIDASDVAVRLEFVDELVTRQELAQRVIAHAGEEEDSALGFPAVELADYVANARLLEGDPGFERNIAVIAAVGQIMDGLQAPGNVGGESTSALLAQARKDENVSAVVLRVDSPGGSVFASELIRREVIALREAGKPVVASMGGVAASGGYWISMSADRIIANPTTITGSIGVFGMFPTFERSLGALGVYTDGVATSSIAGALRPDRSMPGDVRRIVQALVDDDYQRFVQQVAANRGMEIDAVERIAQGQVWTGREALDNGLVDEIGDLEEALVAAATLAELDEGDYGVRYVEPQLSPIEMLALQFLGGAQAAGADLSRLARNPSPLARIAGRIDQALASHARFNDPRGRYAHCFCNFGSL